MYGGESDGIYLASDNDVPFRDAAARERGARVRAAELRLKDVHAKCSAYTELEHAVSRVMLGPCGSNT